MVPSPITPQISDRELVQIAQASGNTAERHAWPELFHRLEQTIRRQAHLKGEAGKDARGMANLLLFEELQSIDAAAFDSVPLTVWARRRIQAKEIRSKAHRDDTTSGVTDNGKPVAAERAAASRTLGQDERLFGSVTAAEEFRAQAGERSIASVAARAGTSVPSLIQTASAIGVQSLDALLEMSPEGVGAAMRPLGGEIEAVPDNPEHVALRAALDQLRSEQREVLVVRYGFDSGDEVASEADIAEILGITTAQVRSRLQAGKAALAGYMKGCSAREAIRLMKAGELSRVGILPAAA